MAILGGQECDNPTHDSRRLPNFFNVTLRDKTKICNFGGDGSLSNFRTHEAQTLHLGSITSRKTMLTAYGRMKRINEFIAE